MRRLLAVFALVLAGTVSVAAEPAARAHLYAALPDWTGIWGTPAGTAVLAGKPPPVPKLWGKPPYTTQAEKQFAPHGFPLDGAPNVIAAAEQTAPAQKICGPAGFPGVMEAPVPDMLFELLVTPEQTLLLATDGTARHIYTDGRGHPKPEDLWPTPVGDSIGHWEGTTLVIDTIAREPGPVGPIPGSLDLSAQAHFTERLRRIDADTMEDSMTIEDPQRSSSHFSSTIRYPRVQDVHRIIPVDCEHDRNTVGEHSDIAPPE